MNDQFYTDLGYVITDGLGSHEDRRALQYLKDAR